MIYDLWLWTHFESYRRGCLITGITGANRPGEYPSLDWRTGNLTSAPREPIRTITNGDIQ